MIPSHTTAAVFVSALLVSIWGLGVAPAGAADASGSRPDIAGGTPDVAPAVGRDLREETRQEPGEAQAPLTSGGKVEKVRMRTIEKALQDLGYAPGPVDGVIDDRAEAAIRAYQADRGQPVNGEVTPELIAALEAGG